MWQKEYFRDLNVTLKSKLQILNFDGILKSTVYEKKFR